MVQRYVMTEYPHECCMEQDDAGQYVLHDDYAALKAENERLKADAEKLERFRPLARWVSNCAGHGINSNQRRLGEELLVLIDAHKGE